VLGVFPGHSLFGKTQRVHNGADPLLFCHDKLWDFEIERELRIDSPYDFDLSFAFPNTADSLINEKKTEKTKMDPFNKLLYLT
jgi:hypothetical protein